jgi:hypothetical protein
MEVLKAINAVQAALVFQGGISKDRKNQAQGYSFRGIDDMYNTLSPMLAKEGLVILPRYEDRQVTEREGKSGNALFYTTLRGDFTFRSVKDGSEVHVSTYGEAMDSGDKATNKAMSAALKYALMQTFTIPTEADNDSENQTHEVKHAALRPGDGSGKIRPASGFLESQPLDMQNHLRDIAHRVDTLCRRGDVAGALDEWVASKKDLSAEQCAAAWDLMEAPHRSAVKRLGMEREKEAA